MADPVLRRLRVLSLFSGIGGLDEGLDRVVGPVEPIYVEHDEAAAQELVERMELGLVARGPVWRGDVRDLDFGAWRGEADLVCGGFPCQDISSAGKGAGLDGERSGLWWEMHRALRETGAGLLFVENVAALAVRGLDRVLGSLADLGFDAEWLVLRASEVGAPHRRERLFLLAWRRDVPDALGLLLRAQQGRGEPGRPRAAEPRDAGAGLVEHADSEQWRLPDARREAGAERGDTGADVGYANAPRREGRLPEQAEGRARPGARDGELADADEHGRARKQQRDDLDTQAGNDADGRGRAFPFTWPPGPTSPAWADVDPAFWPAGVHAPTPDDLERRVARLEQRARGRAERRRWQAARELLRSTRVVHGAEALARLRRVADGPALVGDANDPRVWRRRARLRALGNACIPTQADMALRLLLMRVNAGPSTAEAVA